MAELEVKKRRGGPGKVCYTFLDGKIAVHENLLQAGARLGITALPGSQLRSWLNNRGFYIPKTGGIAWTLLQNVPIEWSRKIQEAQK